MEHSSHTYPTDMGNGFGLLETVRPRESFFGQLRRWFEALEEELEDSRYEIDPLRDYPRDF